MTPYFGIIVSMVAFGIGTFLFKKSKGFFLFTPLFVAMVLGILFLKVGHFSYEEYSSGGKMISFFLEPATIAFAIPLYKQVDVLKKYWVQIVSAIIVGSFGSVVVVYLLSGVIHVDIQLWPHYYQKLQLQQSQSLYQNQLEVLLLLRPLLLFSMR